MAVDLSREIWNEIKRYISSVDRQEAAETLVNILIDNDFDAEDIKQNFKGDNDIKLALSEYLKDEILEDEEDEEDDYNDSY